jgi:hypothetical protein
LTVNILTYKNIPVRENIRALTMSKRTSPLSLITISILPLVHTVPLCHILKPLTDVTVTLCVLPNTITMFHTVEPFTIVNIKVRPCVNSFATNFTILIVSKICISVAESFIAAAVKFIVLPGTFIVPTILINANPKTLSYVLYWVCFTDEVAVLECFDGKIRASLKFFEIK